MAHKRFDQFKMEVNGIQLHFIHQKSSDPSAVPLLLSHGWPGSVFEFHKARVSIPRDRTPPIAFFANRHFYPSDATHNSDH
jgi:hypothetical protein